jgi:hypothetical protein
MTHSGRGKESLHSHNNGPCSGQGFSTDKRERCKYARGPKALALINAKGVNMLEGLTNEEAKMYLEENLTLVALYEI